MKSTALVAGMASEDGERERRRKADLTEDMIVEILARLPVKSLLRFKTLCKLWYSLIVSPNFIAMHSTHSHSRKIVSLFCHKIIPNKGIDPPDTDVSFLFGDVQDMLTFHGTINSVKIVGCFNGIVCLYVSGKRQNFILWNPATGNVRKIGSDVGDQRYEFGFCFDPATNGFKVTQIELTMTHERETRAQVHMFSTATDWWTTKKNIGVLSRIPSRDFTLSQWAICANRYMYWLIVVVTNHPGGTNLAGKYIISYDMIDEVFKLVGLPLSHSFTCNPRLANYKGYLAMFLQNQELARNGSDVSYAEVEVWVMDDCSGASQPWSRLLTCRPALKVNRAVGFFRTDNIDYAILEMDPSGCLYLYDLEKGETRFWKTKSVPETFLYSESLVSLD